MTSTRGKRLRWNTISSLASQITTVICGFILPKLILKSYGSEVNGLVVSITYYLHVITFLELGVGAVVQSSLYKPLAEKDIEETSKIIRSANKFFARIAMALLGYVLVLAIVYPIKFYNEFDHIFTATLLLAISISSFAQYYFGVVDSILLSADQRGYIQHIAQIATLITNTIACAILIYVGASIQIVKLITSVIFLLRPVFLRIYINKTYTINRKIQYTGEPIKQKWNGIAQHIAAVILDQTDIIVLTNLSELSNVSIYSVYHLVIYGVKNLFISLTNGFQSLMGEMLAKKETEALKEFFSWTEWLLHTGTTYIFGCTGILVIPFVSIYTKGVDDANYIVPLFAVLITIAHAGHCLRLPYSILILAAGHYKQTQGNYISAAVMNIVISVLTVKIWGLIGVAIGTLCSMIFQTIWMAYYDSKHILEIPIASFWKHIIIDIITVLIATVITMHIPMIMNSYYEWIVYAVIVALVWGIIILVINTLVYKNETQKMKRLILAKFRR